MIKFFRKIRQELLGEGKTGKYFKYAIGEILLVMIGILLALQVNNWNQERINKEESNAILEQIYTMLDQDMDLISHRINRLQRQINIIDSLILRPNDIDRDILPTIIYHIDTYPDPMKSEITDLIGFLKLNDKKLSRSNLYKRLATYIKFSEYDFHKISKPYVTPILEGLDIPHQAAYFNYSIMSDFEFADKDFYNEDEKEILGKILFDKNFINALKSAKSQKIMYSNFISAYLIEIQTLMTRIENEFEEVKLLYQEVGLVGSATQYDDWTTDIMLISADSKNSIWTADVSLNRGQIKFRVDKEWRYEWGGDSFPEGHTIFQGDNIDVEPGEYRVELNLLTNTYKFIRKVK